MDDDTEDTIPEGESTTGSPLGEDSDESESDDGEDSSDDGGDSDESEGVIIIFTRDRKLEGGKWTSSGWLKDEKAYSIGKGKPILLLVDDCIEGSERKGIHGNLEYVVFRDCLDDSFLRAIPYLRDFRQRILSKTAA
jgi:hypothetical protein